MWCLIVQYHSTRTYELSNVRVTQNDNSVDEDDIGDQLLDVLLNKSHPIPGVENLI